jgi:DNA-binding MarR family transcriptional regulator
VALLRSKSRSGWLKLVYHLKVQGLTPTQGQILAILKSRENEGLRLSEIAESLAVTPATTSDAVSVLVAKGLLQKTKSDQDKRAIAITLTTNGQEQADRVSCWSDFLLAGISELSEEEQVVFLKGLIKIICKLQEQGKIPIAYMCVNCSFFQPNHYPDAGKPHHCGFVNAAFGDRQLQIDCQDYVSPNPELHGSSL